MHIFFPFFVQILEMVGAHICDCEKKVNLHGIIITISIVEERERERERKCNRKYESESEPRQ